MTQTAYAAARSRDPRNQIFGVQERSVVNPLQMQRPSPTSGGGISNPAAMYSAPSQTMLGGGQMTPPDASVNNNVQNLAAQAAQDRQAMVNPSMMQRAQELLTQNQQQAPGAIQGNGSLSGIDIGAPQPAQPNADLSTEQGLENAGLMPSLPVTPPAPLSKDDKTFTTDQVDNSKATVNNLFRANAPQGGVRGATAAKDQDRINNDIQKIAESKNPHQTWQTIQKEPFYQNSSFYTGLMGVGLSIMSGKDPLEAFQIGSSMADQDDMKKQLGGNRDALLDQGYSADSVANAIAQGDPRLLKMRELSPEASAQMQDEREQRRYDRNRADALDDRQFAADQATMNQQASDDRFAKRLQMQGEASKTLIDYRGQKADEKAQKAAESYDFGSRDINAEKNTPEGSNVKQWSTKKGYFTAAEKEHQLAQDAIARYSKTGNEGDRQDATAAFKQMIFNLARGEIGENRSLQGSDLAEFAEDPSIPIRTINDVKLKAGFTPTLDALRYVKAGIDTGIDSMDYNIINTKEQRIRAVAKTLGAKKATALVNRAFGGGWHDPLKAFGDEDDSSIRGRADRSGGALSEDPSWMTQ